MSKRVYAQDGIKFSVEFDRRVGPDIGYAVYVKEVDGKPYSGTIAAGALLGVVRPKLRAITETQELLDEGKPGPFN